MYILQVLTKVCIFLKRPVAFEWHFNILYNSTLQPHWLYWYTCASIRPCAAKATKKNEGEQHIGLTPWFTFDLCGGRQFFLGKSWEAELKRKLKTVFITWEIFGKVTITESDFNNVTSGTLLKWLSEIDSFQDIVHHCFRKHISRVEQQIIVYWQYNAEVLEIFLK